MPISKVTNAELAAVAPLFNNYRVFYGQPSDLALATSFLAERITNEESVILLAKDDSGKPVGFTQLYPSFSSVSAARCPHLDFKRPICIGRATRSGYRQATA